MPPLPVYDAFTNVGSSEDVTGGVYDPNSFVPSVIYKLLPSVAFEVDALQKTVISQEPFTLKYKKFVVGKKQFTEALSDPLPPNFNLEVNAPP